MKSLKELRNDRYLSVRDLAEMAGVTPATVSYIENGKTVPRQKSMRKLAAALGVEPSDVQEFVDARAHWERERPQDES